MARRNRKEDQPIGVGMTARQMKRKKPISSDLMREIEPLTENQKKLFDAYKKNQNLIAYGCSGTGKTFITLYNALKDVLDCKISCCNSGDWFSSRRPRRQIFSLSNSL
jgi:phosphate starvation-inducible protein PhoH